MTDGIGRTMFIKQYSRHFAMCGSIVVVSRQCLFKRLTFAGIILLRPQHEGKLKVCSRLFGSQTDCLAILGNCAIRVIQPGQHVAKQVMRLIRSWGSE